MNNACTRLPLDHAFETRGEDGSDGSFDEVCEVLTLALKTEPWPHFLSLLRARGPELRDNITAILERPVEASSEPEQPTSPLETRLGEVGISDGDLSSWEHAVRMHERAVDLCSELHELKHSVSSQERHHQTEAEKAAWMYEFARVSMYLLAFEIAPPQSVGVPNVLRLAVDSARDAYAHWSVALSLAEDATDAA